MSNTAILLNAIKKIKIHLVTILIQYKSMKNKSSSEVYRPFYRIFNIMKIMVILLFVCVLCVHSSNTYSQTNTFTIKKNNIPIKDFFKYIENESEYVFIFSDEIASDLKQKISVKSEKESLPSILDKALEQQNLTYRIKERQVTILKSTKEQQQAPSLKITGRVIDSKGEPLIGVSIQEVGTNNITVSDIDGKFTLYNITGENSVIRLSYVGFIPQDIKIEKNREFTITLLDDTQGLEEVVIIGYGKQKRESVIGAISTIKPEVLQTNQSRSLTNGLAGQIAGIIAVQRSGEPGFDNSDFWIRGINTFGANSSALVLIDGVERSLSNISSEEIESFSVLKDATATAVYGVRGANGVILIQTKRGKLGKPSITVKGDFGYTTPTQLPEFVGAPKYMEIMNEAYTLSGSSPLYSNETIRRTIIGYDPDLYADVNWLDEITRQYSPNGRASLDINGGSERLRYSFVLAYFNEEGMLITDKNQNYDSQLKMSKFNMRSNVDINITPTTEVAVSIGGYITDRGRPGSGIDDIFYQAMDTPPNVHPKIYSNGQIPQIQARYNPWATTTQTGYTKKFESNIESSMHVTQDIGKLWNPLEGLSARALFSFDSFNYHYQNREKTPRSFIATGRDEEGELITTLVEQGAEFLGYGKSSGGNRTIYFESRLNYSRKFDDHSVEGLFLFNMRDKVIQDASSSILALPYRNTGIAGRSAYGYKDTYFAEFNFGYNGSENFKRGYRFGFFPSFALGWLISNEPFMQKKNSPITKLKVRGSYGLVGNDQIANSVRFAYISTMARSGTYYYGYNGENSLTGWREDLFGVDNLTWETAKKFDLGIELGLWDSINLQLDLFKERRSNIFMSRKTIPEIAGFVKAPYANFGIVDNKGFEVELTVNKQFGKDLFVSGRGNFTFAKNKVIEYDESDELKNSTRAQTGQPLNQYFGLISERLFTEDDFVNVEQGILKDNIPEHSFGTVKPGDIMYKDLNGDEKIDDYDRCPIGKPYVPQVVYGFGLNAKYKNIDFGVFFQGSGNFSNMLYGNALIPGSGGGGTGNIYSNVNDRWTADNPSQDVFWPRLSNTTSSNNMRYSTWWLQDASYLRLKNLELGYTLPKSWQKTIAMRNARVFFRGSNLLTFAKFKMWDPEIGTQDGLKYPLMKVFSVGFEVTF